MHVVFLTAVPVPLVALVLALFLKEVPLRGTARGTAGDVGEGFGMPEGGDARQQLQLAVARLLQRKGRTHLPLVRERSGSTMGTADGWAVGQVYLRARLDRTGHHRGDQPALPAAGGRSRAAFADATRRGYLVGLRWWAPPHRSVARTEIAQGHHRDAGLARRGAQRLGRRRCPAGRRARGPGDQVRRGVTRADPRARSRDRRRRAGRRGHRVDSCHCPGTRRCSSGSSGSAGRCTW